MSASATETLKGPSDLGLEGVAARAATVEQESYFDALGVPDGASAETVRAAYSRLSRAWHPERLVATFHPVRGEVSKIFDHMTRAHQTLCDPEARRRYVATRRATSSPPREEVLRAVADALTRRDFETALHLCRGLTERDADDAEALALEAWASIRGGEAGEDELRAALVKMDRAVSIDRVNDRALYYRGLVHKRLGDVPAAFRDFARAIQLNPSHLAAEREVLLFAMRVRKGSGEHEVPRTLIEQQSSDEP